MSKLRRNAACPQWTRPLPSPLANRNVLLLGPVDNPITSTADLHVHLSSRSKRTCCTLKNPFLTFLRDLGQAALVRGQNPPRNTRKRTLRATKCLIFIHRCYQRLCVCFDDLRHQGLVPRRVAIPSPLGFVVTLPAPFTASPRG